MNRGIYFLANDHMLELSGAFLYSLRRFNPHISLCLIPYDDHCHELRSLSGLYGFEIFDDESVLSRCDAISLQFHEKPSGQYRKLACWEGRFDEFIYVDIDTIVLQSLEFCFSYLSILSFLLATSNSATQRKWVWHDSIDQCELVTEQTKEFAGNTGFIASKRSALPLNSVEERLSGAVALKQHMQLLCNEQPLLNYLITTSGVRYSSLTTMRARFNSRIPIERWGGKPEIPSEDGLLFESEHNICFIHWAGIWRENLHYQSSIWKYYNVGHQRLLARNR